MAAVVTGELRSYLDAHRVVHPATADLEGRPHVMPVTFALTRDAVVFAVDGEPKRANGTALKRIRKILANPRFALLVDDYDDDWNQLFHVLIHGRADVIDTGGPVCEDAICNLRAQYVQYRNLRLTPERNAIVRISPERVHRWRARPPSAVLT